MDGCMYVWSPNIHTDIQTMDVYVCMDVWMYVCMEVWMYGCSGLEMLILDEHRFLMNSLYKSIDLGHFLAPRVLPHTGRPGGELLWMYGCMDVWIYGCMDVCMYGCMDVWMQPSILELQV